MQCAGTGIADFVKARADRGFDVLAAPRAGISLPFTPGRDHHRSLGTSKVTTICIKSFSAGSAILGWNLNVLLQKSAPQIIMRSIYRGCPGRSSSLHSVHR